MELVNASIDQLYAFDIYKAIYSKIPTNITKVIGFQVNGVGNGHVTQAKCIYDILITHFEIPIVVIYGNDDIEPSLFPNSEIILKPFMCTPESVNSGDITSILVDYISPKSTYFIEREHKINLWMNFLVNDFGNYRTKQLAIGPQFSSKNIKIIIPLYFAKKNGGHISCAGILKESVCTDYVLPPLINTCKISRNVDDKLILCYSVSGIDFPSTLRKISRKHKDFTFHYFKNYDPNVRFLKNVVLHSTSRDGFKAYQMRAAAVLCTSGNELIQECVYSGIPVASMSCSEAQEEQIENNEYYTNRGWCVPMHAELNVSELTSSDVSTTQNEITDMIQGRDHQIVDIVNKY